MAVFFRQCGHEDGRPILLIVALIIPARPHVPTNQTILYGQYNAMTAKSIMLLGTHSNAGKSLLAAAFCRILARQGVRVAPFKAQNMSNNAGVTPEGGEMGRAQIVQAEAAGIAPHTDMNPVLLKPEANRRSQIVLNGKAHGHIEAANWFDIKQMLWGEVQAAYDRLAARYDVIVMEGAGSPAEINLKAGDIVNLRMARHANAPCLLIGDIDRGGVFAALAGTLLLLEPGERAQISGFLINKFRGDPAMLGNATEMLQEKAFGVPTLGVIPFIPDLQIADEDAVVLDEPTKSAGDAEVDIAILRLPHIANFDEFDALAVEPNVSVRFVESIEKLGIPDALIVPGSKVTLSDLQWLRKRGFITPIWALYNKGVAVVGICGGYQMLGRSLADPLGVESQSRELSTNGIGLLEVETTFVAEKHTHQAEMNLYNGATVLGYEIHMGETRFLRDEGNPFGQITMRNGEEVQLDDGAISDNGRVWGTYLHGIFENEGFRREWLRSLGWRGSESSLADLREAEYDRLADAVQANVDWAEIERVIRGQ